MEALISTLFSFPFPLLGEKMTINLKIRFRKKMITLPIYTFDKGNFIIIMPIYENGKLVDIVKLNLPIQVVANPSKELYRFLRMRGVI